MTFGGFAQQAEEVYCQFSSVLRCDDKMFIVVSYVRAKLRTDTTTDE